MQEASVDCAATVRHTGARTSDLMRGRPMDANNLAQQRSSRNWLTEDHCDLEEFRTSVARRSAREEFPLAADFQRDVPVYDCRTRIRDLGSDTDYLAAVQAEWAAVWLNGPGIVVLKKGQPDTGLVDETSEVFRALIAEQKAAGQAAGDHFAKPARCWIFLEPRPSERWLRLFGDRPPRVPDRNF